MVGRQMVATQSSHLPLKVNIAGVIPVIFASSVLAIPQTCLLYTSDAADELLCVDLGGRRFIKKKNNNNNNNNCSTLNEPHT